MVTLLERIMVFSYALKIVSLIYFMVSEINILTKFCLTICYTFIHVINCTSFEKMHGFSINMQLKNNLSNKMQITYFLMISMNINFDHVCHVICIYIHVIFLFMLVIVTYE